MNKSNKKTISHSNNFFIRNLRDRQNFYGRKNILRSLLALPQWFPINIYYPHGIAHVPFSIDFVKEIDSWKSRVAFVHRAKDRDFLVKHSEYVKEAYVFEDLFTLYKKHLHRRIKKEQKGTLFFLSHSSRDTTALNNLENIYDSLINLDEKYQPVTVCLYWVDYLKGDKEFFENKGFEVVCNGTLFDKSFAQNFYTNLDRFKYTAGNSIGSHTFYAIEAGKPYFNLGNQPTSYLAKKGDFIFNQGTNESFSKSKSLIQLSELSHIENLTDKGITAQKEQIARENLGCDSSISLREAKQVILRDIKSTPIKFISNRIKI